jgi:hypothetical protein
MLQWPFLQAAEIWANLGLQRQGAGAGPFDRTADPETGACGLEERVAAKAAVAEDAVAGLAVGGFEGGLQAELLNAPIFSGVAPSICSSCMRWSKAKTRMVDRSLWRLVAQWICSRAASLRRAFSTTPRLRKNCSSSQTWVGRGAAVAADGEGTAGVGVGEGFRPGLTVQPAFQKAGHEAVAGAEDVEDLDREAGAGLAVVKAVGDIAGEGGGTHRAAFADEGGFRHGADGAQGGDGVGGAAGDVKLFLGADDEVEVVQRGLQLGGDLGRIR